MTRAGKGGSSARPSRVRRQRGRIAGALLLVIVAGAVTSGLPRDRGSETVPEATGAGLTTTTSAPAPLLAFEDPPSTYHIVYRVEHGSDAEVTVSTDALWVKRPFASRLESRAGPPPGDETSSVVISNFGLLASSGPNSAPLVVRITPGVPNGDLRLGGVIEELSDGGALRPTTGRRLVQGRTCQVFRTGEPIGTGQLIEPTEDESTEVCIDAAGLVLEETWKIGGEILRHKVAVTVETDLEIDDDLVQPTDAVLAAEAGGGEVIPVTASSRPAATFWELDEPPFGFSHRGRYLVRAAGAPADTGASRPEIMVDVYVSGPDFVLIAQGNSESTDGERTGGRHVALGALEEGLLRVDVFGATVLAQPDAVRYVQVSGTIEPERVVAVAAALEPRPRGEIEPLDAG